MKWTSLAFVMAFTVSAFAQNAPPRAGAVFPSGSGDTPRYIEVVGITLPQGLDAIPVAALRRSTTMFGVTFSDGADVDAKLSGIIDALRAAGPVHTVGLHMRETSPLLQAYAVKRLAGLAQGQDLASATALRFTTPEAAAAAGATYVDAWIVDESLLPTARVWVEKHDPGAGLVLLTAPAHENALYDLARGLAGGARTVFLNGPLDFAAFEGEFAGDFAFDSSSGARLLDGQGNELAGDPPLAFVRGEDLRTLLVPPGNGQVATIAAIPASGTTKVRRVDAQGARSVTDTGTKDSLLLIGLQPSRLPFLLTIDRAASDPNVTTETIEIAATRGLEIDEIIRQHQAYDAFQRTITPRYIARNTTKLRFGPGSGSQIEITVAGDNFFDPAGRNDWVWDDLYIDGVKWRHGKIPALPLFQPEKVSQLPLEIQLTNDYRYSLVRETRMDGYDTYEVDFEPPETADRSVPLYRGTAWIDARTFARVRMTRLQVHLSDQTLSNEETLEFVPFDASTWTPLTVENARARNARDLLWLPVQIASQQVLSVGGSATTIARVTAFTTFRLAPADFDVSLAEAERSNKRMVRDTEQGVRYLTRQPDGTRRPEESVAPASLFGLGGIHHDEGQSIPVSPLGGVIYNNFDLGGRGVQANVFFAGVILGANVSKPAFFGTRATVSGDAFVTAISFTNRMYRDFDESIGETVDVRPLHVTGRVSRPVLGFGNLTASLRVESLTYGRSDDTASGFVVPESTLELVPEVGFKFARLGYTFTASGEYGMRTKWEPWGDPAEYSEDQQNFSRWSASFGKQFYLPKFQRLGIEVGYVDGRNLDRFSKFELSNFGSHKIRGLPSGTVRAERSTIAHLSYGFVISDQIRIEGFYDHGWIDDATAGYRQEEFQGVGIAGQLVGPFGTLVRFDLGKSIGRNAQDGFVADILFLKILPFGSGR